MFAHPPTVIGQSTSTLINLKVSIEKQIMSKFCINSNYDHEQNILNGGAQKIFNRKS